MWRLERMRPQTADFSVPQVPDSALPLREAAAPPPGAPLRQPVHHRGGVLQKDHRKRAHHQTPLGHVQVQRYMNSGVRGGETKTRDMAGAEFLV